jgi:hypothetical protein
MAKKQMVYRVVARSCSSGTRWRKGCRLSAAPPGCEAKRQPLVGQHATGTGRPAIRAQQSPDRPNYTEYRTRVVTASERTRLYYGWKKQAGLHIQTLGRTDKELPRLGTSWFAHTDFGKGYASRASSSGYMAPLCPSPFVCARHCAWLLANRVRKRPTDTQVGLDMNVKSHPFDI